MTAPYIGNNHLRSIAFHEAGHAVMCLHLGREFKFVTIEKDATFNGRVDGVTNMGDKTQSINNIMIALAGLCAQNMVDGTKFNILSQESDREFVLRNLSMLEPQAIGSMYKELNRSTSYILKCLWWKVEAIAEALEQNKTLYYQDCKKIWKQ